MKNAVLSLFVIIAACAANARPSKEAVDLLKRGYSSEIKVRTLSSEDKGLGNWAVCQMQKLAIAATDPLTRGPSQISASFFQRRIFGVKLADSRAVIILPPLGGITPIDETYAFALCTIGFRVVILEDWAPHSRDEIDLEAHDRQSIRAAATVRHLVEFLAPTRNTQVGVFGTSAGAILGALATGFDTRLSVAAFIVGGGGLPEIIATSTEPGLVKLREERMRKFGYRNVEEYRRALERSIRIEPLDFVNFSGPKRVLTMVAEQDRMVPTANQWILYRAFGSQDLLRYNGSHRLAIADAFLTKHRDFITFFDTHLK